MIESQLRALFTEIAGGEPGSSRVDTQLARRRGRTRLRWRRAYVAGTPVLAAVAVVALAVGALPARPGARPSAAGPAAPRQFNPMIPYVSFGWLPAGNSLVSGGTGRTVMYLTAGPKLDARSEWSLSVYAAGRCTLAAAPRRLTCSATDSGGPAGPTGPTAQISGHAPAVRGHRAFWAGPSLVWQYTRGGWAWLDLPFPYGSPLLRDPVKRDAIKRDAVRVADHIRYGAAAPPLVFPARLTRLPSQWRVSSVYYLPDAGVLRAGRYVLITGSAAGGVDFDGGLEFQNNLPWVEIDPVTSRHNSCYRYPNRKNSSERSTPEIINGYRVIVSHLSAGTVPRQQVCAGNADGLAVLIAELGPHPAISATSLFGHHLRLLGTNPANWTRKPIG